MLAMLLRLFARLWGRKIDKQIFEFALEGDVPAVLCCRLDIFQEHGDDFADLIYEKFSHE